MARGGRTKERDAPERRCIASGTSGGTFGLIRFVVGPDGMAVPDLAEKLPGRGMWVTSERAALDLVEKKKLFSRAAKQQVAVPAGLADLLERLLTRRVQDQIALARKAGLAVNGFMKVDAALRTEQMGVLIEASDGSERQRAKLRSLAGDTPNMALLSGEELGVAFGRDHVIHAALSAGGVTDRVLRDAARLSGVRVVAPSERPDQDDTMQETGRDTPGDER
ncbi:hypothetical protein FHS89_000019 [Rubricella aquisinus]|uniref:YlxR domain-containing protein n=1 Tax=Rubricella aquisinus TaxID=2028108 RepID=A0A840WHR7_9RHOB|nr:hypothetical protein [Rubricella aquisinus]